MVHRDWVEEGDGIKYGMNKDRFKHQGRSSLDLRYLLSCDMKDDVDGGGAKAVVVGKIGGV